LGRHFNLIFTTERTAKRPIKWLQWRLFCNVERPPAPEEQQGANPAYIYSHMLTANLILKSKPGNTYMYAEPQSAGNGRKHSGQSCTFPTHSGGPPHPKKHLPPRLIVCAFVAKTMRMLLIFLSCCVALVAAFVATAFTFYPFCCWVQHTHTHWSVNAVPGRQQSCVFYYFLHRAAPIVVL